MAQAPGHRAVVPAQPDDRRASTSARCSGIVDFAREREVLLVHDFAYADPGFDGYEPPSILQVPGAKDVAVELYTLTKSFSMAGWRVGFLVGNAEVVGGAGEAQELPRLRHVPADPDRGDRDDERGARLPERGQRDLPVAPRRADRRPEPHRLGDREPRGTMFVWAPIPEPYEEMGTLEFATLLVAEAKVAVSPGIGFGPGGEGYVRFALIENEQRIAGLPQPAPRPPQALVDGSADWALRQRGLYSVHDRLPVRPLLLALGRVGEAFLVKPQHRPVPSSWGDGDLNGAVMIPVDRPPG